MARSRTRVSGKPISPFTDAAAVVLNDATVLNDTAGVYVGGTGDLKVTMADGGVVTFKAVPVGTTLNISASILWSTGSTATLVIALY